MSNNQWPVDHAQSVKITDSNCVSAADIIYTFAREAKVTA